jgi:hypothetical protein
MTANELPALTVTVLVVCAWAVIGSIAVARSINAEQSKTPGLLETLRFIADTPSGCSTTMCG